MAIERKYGNLNISKIGEDEPVIVFRAQDILSIPILNHYVKLCYDNGCTKEHIGNIEVTIMQFNRWQETNKTKLPD